MSPLFLFGKNGPTSAERGIVLQKKMPYEPLWLQSWRPSKEVPKPWPGKVPKKVLRKVPVRNWVPRKVPKKVLGVPRLCRGSIGDGTRSTFSGTFLGTPFRTGTFRSTFSALFLARASALLWMAARIVTLWPKFFPFWWVLQKGVREIFFARAVLADAPVCLILRLVPH